MKLKKACKKFLIEYIEYEGKLNTLISRGLKQYGRKFCKGCGYVKRRDKFSLKAKNPVYCADCQKKKLRKYVKENADRVKEVAVNYKSRPEIKEKNRLNSKKHYNKHKNDPEFKKKQSENAKKWYKNNREHRLEVGKKWRKNNPEKAKEINRRYDKEKRREYGRKYRRENKDKLNMKRMLRFKHVQISTPSWVNMEEIQKYYKTAKYLKEILNKKFCVDHIIPLNSDIVCGLNVPWNLQILESKLNESKGNNFDGTYFNNTWSKSIDHL